jgi:hypothetical protein
MTKKKTHDEYDEPLPQDAAPEELSPEEEARDLLKTMALAAKHNSPVTPLMLAQVGKLIGHVTGQPVAKPLHRILDDRGHLTSISIRTAEGPVDIDTAEEALVYLRGLPIETQKQAHWVAADKALTETLTFVEGADITPAIRKFQVAADIDRALEVRQVEVPPRDPSLEPPPPAPAPEAEHA